jgi:hypothetical protein
VTFAVSATAALGTHNVTVSNPAGTSTPVVPITVQGATLTSIAPSSGVRGTTVPVTLTGTNLGGATAVNVAGNGVTCAIVTPAPTATTVNASCAITAGALPTARSVTVVTPIGTTPALTGGFTVN